MVRFYIFDGAPRNEKKLQVFGIMHERIIQVPSNACIKLSTSLGAGDWKVFRLSELLNVDPLSDIVPARPKAAFADISRSPCLAMPVPNDPSAFTDTLADILRLYFDSPLSSS